MGTRTLIITYVTHDYQEPYLFRSMRNVDEQTHRNWHHAILVDKQVSSKTIESLAALRSEGYKENYSILEYQDRNTLGTNFDYVAIHPIEDTWSPLFLEKMITEIQECPYVITGAVSQYNWVKETLNGKLIVAQGMEEAAKIEVGLLAPKLDAVIDLQHTNVLYEYTADFDRLVSREMTAPQLVLMTIADSDFLGLPEVLAFKQDNRSDNVDMEKQSVRNWCMRTFPKMV